MPHGYCGKLHEQLLERSAAEAPPNDPSYVGRSLYFQRRKCARLRNPFANSPPPAALPRFSCGLTRGMVPRQQTPQSGACCTESRCASRLPEPIPAKPCAAWLTLRCPCRFIGTGPESGAFPRGHQLKWAIRFRLPRKRDRLPDRLGRTAIVRQSIARPDDGPERRWQHDRPSVGETAFLPVCIPTFPPKWPADHRPNCMSN